MTSQAEMVTLELHLFHLSVFGTCKFYYKEKKTYKISNKCGSDLTSGGIVLISPIRKMLMVFKLTSYTFQDCTGGIKWIYRPCRNRIVWHEAKVSSFLFLVLSTPDLVYRMSLNNISKWFVYICVSYTIYTCSCFDQSFEYICISRIETSEKSLKMINEDANLLWPEPLECSGWPWS